MSAKASILIIEDDYATAGTLKTRLKAAGYAADTCDEGREGLERAKNGAFDVVILDVMLPGMNGFDVLQGIRDANLSCKILMLTARTDFNDRVKGLTTGADDYLAKPFDHREVLLRIEKLLANAAAAAGTVEVGDILLSKEHRMVTRGGVAEELTDREYDLLLYLMEHAGEVTSKETLLKEIWKTDFERDPNVVNVYLSYLRKKLERKGLPSPIETVHGAGIKIRE